jgi:hypothetical protein
MGLVVWFSSAPLGFCSLTALQNVDKSWELKFGISRSDGFPITARFDMDPSHPKAIKLADCIYNANALAVISQALKEFIESRQPPRTEFLPVSIYNHKKRLASDSYFILNPLSLPDCIDMKKSKITWNKIKKDLIAFCKKLVLEPSAIDPDLLLLRPKFLPSVILVREDLAEAIGKQGFTGVKFIPIDRWKL